ncbi:protein phosphatase methylesterase-1 related [Anaeramoeba flamelloides]|uniref:Protein phosphatase methylesterase 1 n=1 Tax=Anaeramoeba flamelloides TaxID=1746091 RepID=A0AAV7ZR46_9EUKA|nr:protein phosphatase methylesterase-1 related [Anaeramoeba flamelloides]KAJ6238933.1 protein phosphatase methylesterase-1 related [Anaeramoeba flamelloides]
MTNQKLASYKWENHFTEKIDLAIKDTNDTFRVYRAGADLTESELIIFLIHGTGYTSLTWAPLIQKILLNKPNVSIYTYDLRGHGCTTVEKASDLRLETLTKDTTLVINQLGLNQVETPMMLIGHSLGGIIAVETAKYHDQLIDKKNKSNEKENQKTNCIIENIKIVMIIDIVGTSGLKAIPFMKRFYSDRKNKFQNLNEAINYALESGISKNRMSARISVPTQLKYVEEEDKENNYFTWNFDVVSSLQYWESWFQNLNQNFLSIKATKVLVLSNLEHMDKDITTAHMSGKFQLIPSNRAGHAVHEDVPDYLAQKTISIVNRYLKVKAMFSKKK